MLQLRPPVVATATPQVEAVAVVAEAVVGDEEGGDECYQENETEAEENNIVELARIIPYLCSNHMNPVWQVCMI